jgi:hypothetical protein
VLSLRKSNQTHVFMRFYDGLARPPRTDIMPPFEHGEKMRTGWADALDQYQGQRLLFGIRPEEVAVLKDPRVLERVAAPDGSDAFVLAEAEAVKDFVHTWRILGPYAPDEAGEPPAFDPAEPWAEGPGGRRWRLYRKRLASVGLNDFFALDADDTCAWALNFVASPTARRAVVWAGFDDVGEVWFNGEPVDFGYSNEDEDSLADALVAEVELHAGRNSIAIWTCDERADWRFYFRLSAPDGDPLPDLTWEFHDRSDGR